MTQYTDLELTEMHAEGVPCPDDDHAREHYALLDWLDEQLRAQRDLQPDRIPATPGLTDLGGS